MISTKLVAYAILTILAAGFAVKTFLYGGSSFQDPNDSPLYKSTLVRAVDNFKDSDYVVSRDGAPGKPSPGTAAQGYAQQHAAAQQDPAAQALQTGLQMYGQKKFKEAAIWFEYAAKLSPNYPAIYSYIGMAYDKAGDKEKSNAAYQKAAAQQPKPQPGTTPGTSTQKVSHPAATASVKDYMDAAVALYRQGNYKDAAAYFESVIKLEPKNMAAYNWLGSCCFALRDNDRMIQAYESAAKAAPDDAEANYNLGIAYMAIGKNDKAREAYSKAVQINPQHTHAHAGLGKLLQAEGKTDEALKEFQYEIDSCRKLIEGKPDDAAAYNRLANFYLQYNLNLKEAVEVSDKAISLKADDPNYLATAAQLQFKAGNRDKALALVDKALAIAPESPYFKALKSNMSAVKQEPGKSSETKPSKENEAKEGEKQAE